MLRSRIAESQVIERHKSLMLGLGRIAEGHQSLPEASLRVGQQWASLLTVRDAVSGSLGSLLRASETARLISGSALPKILQLESSLAAACASGVVQGFAQRLGEAPGICKAFADIDARTRKFAELCADPFGRIGEQFRSVSEEMNRVVGLAAVSVSGNGTFTFRGEEFSKEDVEDALEAAHEAAGESVDTYDPVTYLRQVLRHVASKLRPSLGGIVLALLLNIVGTAIWHHAITPCLESKRGERAITRRELRKAMDAIGYAPGCGSADDRIVARRLVVRARPSHRAKAIGIVLSLDRVHVIERRGRWTKVRPWCDGPDGLVEGWVFTRYLRQIP